LESVKELQNKVNL